MKRLFVPVFHVFEVYAILYCMNVILKYTHILQVFLRTKILHIMNIVLSIK